MNYSHLIVGKPAEVKDTPPKSVKIHFYPRDGRAYAYYTGPNVASGVEYEVKSRDDAVKCTRRAVERANEFNTTMEFLHGPADRFDEVRGFCLSAQAESACKAELKSVKNQSKGMWKVQF